VPSLPIEYRIVRDAQTALQAISQASGYHFNLAALAVKLDPDQAVEALVTPHGPRPFILLEMKDEEWEYDAASEVFLVLPMTVYWVSDAAPSSDEARLETYYKGCSDVEVALVSTPEKLSRGGLAIDTRIVNRRLDTSVDGTEVWALIDVRMRLRRQYGQPNG
jgi:hypothetical protein